jgi:outer membrane protein assembly factor BamB
MTQTDTPSQTPQLRLWPGALIVALQWFGRFVLPVLWPDGLEFGVMGSLLGGLAVLIWWAFFSRVPRTERWGAVIMMPAALMITSFLVDESIATGMMGMLLPLFAVPVLSLALVVWAAGTGRWAIGLRRASLAVAILLACGIWTLVRTGGFSSDLDHDFAWRWTATPEELLVAQTDTGQPTSPTSLATTQRALKGNWPGFRGPDRNGIVQGVQIETDWHTVPPLELWRRPVGPGWSSFAVDGDRIYTQEQRGEEEAVSCYDLNTGEELWRHADPVRFWESNAGAGPRGTPTLSAGHLYALGATGILNALNADDGTLVWSRDAAKDTGAQLPGWGFSGSPLVVGDAVIVATSGTLIAYGIDAGTKRWVGPAGGEGYSSPQLLTISGKEQIVQLSGEGAWGLDPSEGKVLWQHPWPGYPIVQPALSTDGDLLISAGERQGIRRLALTPAADGWTATERWTSTGLKPYFNDFVVHNGHAFGFDGRLLACIDLSNGQRRWKGGRYGSGQLILLADQDLLVVQAEKGDLALVQASPDRFTELARVAAIKGKTWNHPVLAGDILLVRNSEEMAAFRLGLIPPNPLIP